MTKLTFDMPSASVSSFNSGQEYKTSNFSPAFLFLSGSRRAALKAIYSFCREVDDIVDEGENRGSSASLLEAWTAFIRQKGVAPREELGARLAAAVRDFDIPQIHLLEIIEGVRMDLTQTRYENFEGLKKYCYGVASAVGLCCLPIFGVPIPEARDYAVSLGIAFQLTNILRDVGTDAGRGRVYLPLEDLKRFGCSEQDLFARISNDRLMTLMRFQTERARGFYGLAVRSLPSAWRRRLLPARVMTAMYQGILNKIERGGFRVFEGKAVLSAFSKWAAVIRTILGG
jgi:phytoene synthase